MQRLRAKARGLGDRYELQRLSAQFGRVEPEQPDAGDGPASSVICLRCSLDNSGPRNITRRLVCRIGMAASSALACAGRWREAQFRKSAPGESNVGPDHLGEEAEGRRPQGHVLHHRAEGNERQHPAMEWGTFELRTAADHNRTVADLEPHHVAVVGRWCENARRDDRLRLRATQHCHLLRLRQTAAPHGAAQGLAINHCRRPVPCTLQRDRHDKLPTDLDPLRFGYPPKPEEDAVL